MGWGGVWGGGKVAVGWPSVKATQQRSHTGSLGGEHERNFWEWFLEGAAMWESSTQCFLSQRICFWTKRHYRYICHTQYTLCVDVLEGLLWTSTEITEIINAPLPPSRTHIQFWLQTNVCVFLNPCVTCYCRRVICTENGKRCVATTLAWPIFSSLRKLLLTL